ncbi:MAG TPA: biopolymer transporter ExbD [Thermoanaerobaculia bacterium]|nr:biopolymer transporter ExbD [Thermoanaerobaculia bacterium]
MQLPSAKAGFRSEINVTPLVDVCLVLLIIFMVVTPLLRQEIPIQLPETGHSKLIVEHPQIEVSMLEDQTVLVEHKAVPLRDLPGVLRRLHAADPDRPVIVQGDKRLRYEQLSRVLESVDEAGFQRVGLVTVRRARGG